MVGCRISGGESDKGLRFEQRLEGGEGFSLANIWGSVFQAEERTKAMALS